MIYNGSKEYSCYAYERIISYYNSLICKYTYMALQTHVHTHTPCVSPTPTHTHTRWHTHGGTVAHTHVHTHTHTHTHIHMHTHLGLANHRSVESLRVYVLPCLHVCSGIMIMVTALVGAQK